MKCLINLAKHYEDVEIIIQQGALVHLNRELIVIEAKKRECSHLLFVDSDMVFSFAVLERLLLADKDIVAGLFHYKRSPKEAVCKPNKEIPDKLFKCDWVGTGCILIRMEVFEKIKRPWFFFEPPNKEGGIGEDIWFCRKAKEAGYNIWIEPEAPVGHLGLKIY